jgi:hypothetical protein
MYRSSHARELDTLLRLSRELDIVGDVTARVDNPSELIAWAASLNNPSVVAWRAKDSGFRYVQVSADHPRAPVRGRIAAVLSCEAHPEFWKALGLGPIKHGATSGLSLAELRAAWSVMPIASPGGDVPTPEPPVTDTEAIDE